LLQIKPSRDARDAINTAVDATRSNRIPPLLQCGTVMIDVRGGVDRLRARGQAQTAVHDHATVSTAMFGLARPLCRSRPYPKRSAERQLAGSAAIVLTSVPSFSTLASMRSPGLSQTGFSDPAMTPAGAPEVMTSPGSRVMLDHHETKSRTP
jgi:hypothetical protein